MQPLFFREVTASFEVSGICSSHSRRGLNTLHTFNPLKSHEHLAKGTSIFILLMCLAFCANSQQAFYDVIAANGNRLRFWSSDAFQVHKDKTAEYHFDLVTDL